MSGAQVKIYMDLDCGLPRFFLGFLVFFVFGCVGFFFFFVFFCCSFGDSLQAVPEEDFPGGGFPHVEHPFPSHFTGISALSPSSDFRGHPVTCPMTEAVNDFVAVFCRPCIAGYLSVRKGLVLLPSRFPGVLRSPLPSSPFEFLFSLIFQLPPVIFKEIPPSFFPYASGSEEFPHSKKVISSALFIFLSALWKVARCEFLRPLFPFDLLRSSPMSEL